MQAWDAAWKVGSDADRQKLRPRILGLARELNDVELAGARRVVDTKDVGKLLDRQIALRQPSALEEPMPELNEAEEGQEQTAKAEPAFDESGPGPVATPAGQRRDEPKPVVPEIEPEVGAAQEQAPAVTAKAAGPSAGESVAAPLVAEKPIEGPAKIGCLLPLSGPAQRFGERSLRGVRLIFGEGSDAFVLKDTGSDSELTVKMFEELNNDPNVLVVIGPLRGEDSEAVAGRAERARVPLLLLSPRDGLGGRFVLQVGITRSRQVSTLLDYAMEKMRLRRFGVVYPNDPYGKEFLSAFRSGVERRGGATVGIAAYPPTTQSIADEIGTVRKWRDTQNVQAVFLPDTATVAAEFAEGLQREMPDITLLGVHGWESLADQGGLNGILFTDGFYAGSERAETRDLVDRFKQAYDGQTPGVLEAQAYDAALLAQRAVAAGARSRPELLSRIQDLGSVAGASGDLRLTPDGLQRSLFLLQVYDGKLQEISATAG
jgi:ABC-type branched-subunit amino acid transport system substrate-binding protein